MTQWQRHGTRRLFEPTSLLIVLPLLVGGWREATGEGQPRFLVATNVQSPERRAEARAIERVHHPFRALICVGYLGL